MSTFCPPLRAYSQASTDFCLIFVLPSLMDLMMCVFDDGLPLLMHINSIVSKVMADAQRSAYSWRWSFLLSVRIIRAQCHDRLPILLMEDTETTGNKDEAVWMVRWQCVYAEEKEGGDHEMTARELKLNAGICLTFPWRCPRALRLIILTGKNLFSIYFTFIWVSGWIFISSFVPALVSERGAVKCITLTVLT